MESKQPQLAVDPNLATEQAQAQQTLVAGLQAQAQIDTAKLMTRYGTKLALGSAGIADPATAPATESAPDIASMFKSMFKAA